jgi:hypothetical protein
MRRLLKEPLVHFVALALAIFAIYGLLNRGGAAAPDQIVVTAPRIAQMATIFAKTWQRPPTADELKGLIDDYVKEEIYYREALTLGLDKDDAVIRRRLRLKMEFLSDAAVDALTPTDAELEAYLKAHPSDYAFEPMLAFQQVFFNAESRGDKTQQDAAATLEALRTRPDVGSATLGDASLLPADLPLTAKTAIAQTFGPEFADALAKAEVGRWTGPIRSSYGLHLVRISERKAERTPALSEVRDAVARDWAEAGRKDLEDRRLADLLKRYRVTIESPAAPGAAP